MAFRLKSTASVCAGVDNVLVLFAMGICDAVGME